MLTSRVRIEQTPIEVVRADKGLVDRLLGVVAGSYVDPRAALDYALSRNTHVHLLTDGGEVRAYCFAAYETLMDRPAVYIGLAGTEVSDRSKGRFRALLRDFAVHVRAHEDRLQANAVVYARTAHPSAYRALCSVLDVDPKPDGSYSPENGDLARALRTVRYDDGSTGHPFVLRASAKYYYSEREHEYIARVRSRLGPDVIGLLGVDERRGDRLLLLMSLHRDGKTHV
jgi:hypothetical protein